MSDAPPGGWPSVSIITINYNGLEHLADCFDSLRELDYPRDRFEVVCVDNDSVDGSVAFIRANYPEVRLIESGSNLGFAAGCNLGARECQSEHIAFLNNDAKVNRAWLKALVRALSPAEGRICASAKMLDWEGETVDFVEGHLTFHGFARQAHWREWHREGDFEASRLLLFACGGAMLIDRSIFLEVGGFDERFWMFFEDVDLGWRLWVLGYQVVFVPDAITYHRHHGSAGSLNTYRRNFLYERNGLMMVLKNYDQETLLRALPASLALMVHRSSDYLQRAAGGFDMLAPETWHALDEDALDQRISLGDLAPLVAMRAVMSQMPEIMAERDRIQALRKREDADILPLFGQPRRLYPMGHMLIQDYCEAHQNLWRALGLDRIFENVAARIAVLTNAGLPGLGFPDSPEGRRAEALGKALVAAGHDVIWCLPRRLVEAHPEARLDARTQRFTWDDRTLDNRLLRLGPDLILATHWRCLAFARLSVYRPVVLDHEPSDPIPAFDAEIRQRFDGSKERAEIKRALLKRDYLANVDLFTADGEPALSELKRWLREACALQPSEEQLLNVPARSLERSESKEGESTGSAAAMAAGQPSRSQGLAPGFASLDAYCRAGAYPGGKLAVDFAPPFPHTPVWELPAKAWRNLRRHGIGGLLDESKQYGRWLWHGLQRRMARHSPASRRR